MVGEMDRAEGNAVDETVRSYSRRFEAIDAELERLRDRDAWRTYAAAALEGMLAARLVASDARYRGDGLAHAAEIADDMLALERARFRGRDGNTSR